jgi:hypothetical protein
VRRNDSVSPAAYTQMEEAQQKVDQLIARWAELDQKQG